MPSYMSHFADTKIKKIKFWSPNSSQDIRENNSWCEKIQISGRAAVEMCTEFSRLILSEYFSLSLWTNKAANTFLRNLIFIFSLQNSYPFMWKTAFYTLLHFQFAFIGLREWEFLYSWVYTSFFQRTVTTENIHTLSIICLHLWGTCKRTLITIDA